MNKQAQVVVVGNGLIGAAATRHLAERGVDVLCIGAPATRPDIRTGPDAQVADHAVYSSHNDAARLTRRQDRDVTWARVTERAVSRYRYLEEASGISFFRDVGCLIASRPGGDGINADPVDMMDTTDVAHTMHPPGDQSWRTDWPALALPETHYVAFEPSPAGYLRPKRLLAAFNLLAESAGARLVPDTVTNIERTEGRFRVMTHQHGHYEADQVLVAAGAFANFNNLLPQPAELRLKSEVIVLGEVSEADAIALGDYPTVKYLIDPGDIEGIYMTPAMQYEDGRHYIKFGANTRLDQELTALNTIQQWFNTDTDPDYLPLYEPVMRSLWPTTEFLSITTQSCIITYTPTKIPLIEPVADGLFVATAGNGGGAKGCDAWGEMAADLITN